MQILQGMLSGNLGTFCHLLDMLHGNTHSFITLFKISEYEKRVFALHCRHWLDGVRATDGLRSRFRQTRVLHFFLCNQVLGRSCHILNGYIGSDPVLIEQIDDLCVQTPQRCLRDLLNMLRAVIFTPMLPGLWIDVMAKLGGDYHLVAQGSQCFANQGFIDKGP